jgi:hypothetical protein
MYFFVILRFGTDFSFLKTFFDYDSVNGVREFDESVFVKKREALHHRGVIKDFDQRMSF